MSVNNLAINDMSSDERKCMFVLILYEVLLPIKKIQLVFDLLHTFVGVVSLRCPSPLHSTNAVPCCISGGSMALSARFDRLAWNQTPNNWLASHI